MTTEADQKVMITAKFLDGKSHKFEVDPSSSILDLKSEICSANRMYAVNHTVLLFRGKLYKNSRNITECGIKNSDTVHVLLNLGGPNNSLCQNNAL